MPTYQYACTECDHAFDQVQTFSDDALTTCPQCEGRLRKLFNAVGVVFKGSGFYRTDSRTDAKKDARNGSSSGSTTETKTDAKPDSKPDAKSPTTSDTKTTSDSPTKAPAPASS